MAVTDSETKRCDNLACLCNIPFAQAACSDACASPETNDAATIRCACGHDGCRAVVESQLHGGIGAESL
jgi:hypothetical protein